MSEINVTGECDPKFSEIQDIFQEVGVPVDDGAPPPGLSDADST